MALPTFGAVGGAPAGDPDATACNVPVPTGVVANSVVLIAMYVETTQAVTPPAGWTLAPDAPIVVTGTEPQNLHVFWHRATGSESGTYNFTIAAGLSYRDARAFRFEGCVTSGTPFEVTNSAAKTTTTTGATPAVTDTTTVADCEWVHFATSWNLGSFTPFTGFTEIFDAAAVLAAARKDQAAAGSSGSVVGTFSANGSNAAWLGALLPVASGSSYNVGATGTVTADGTGTAVLSRVAGATGTVTADGSGAAILAAVAAATGTVTAGGTASVTLSRVVGAAETVVAGGTAAATNAKLVAATGTVTAGGTGTAQLAAVAAATGTVTAGGTAGMVRNLAAAATGTVTAGGAGAGLLARLLAATGTVTAGGTAGAAVTSTHPYLTAVSTNGRYFEDQNGQPFQVRGDSPWAAMYALTTTADVDLYVEARAGQGYNVMLVSAIVGPVNGGTSSGATSDSVSPFSGGFNLNSTYWSRLDYFITKCRDEGITVLLYVLDSWTVGISGTAPFSSASTTQCEDFAAAVVTRYANTTTYPNIVWMIGGDWLLNQGGSFNDRLIAGADGIRSVDTGRLMSVQVIIDPTDNHTYGNSYESPVDENLIDWTFVYAWICTYDEVLLAYAHSWPTTGGGNQELRRPALSSEIRYLNDFETPTMLDHRKQICWAYCAGSPGEIWGTEYWDFSVGWEDDLNQTGISAIKALRDWWGAIDWHTLVCNESLITTGAGTRVDRTDQALPSANSYAIGAVGGGGAFAVLYIPTSRSIVVDTSLIDGAASATWIDPVSADTTSATFGTGYTTPGTNDGGNTDWLLLIEGSIEIDATGTVTAGGTASVTLSRVVGATGQVTAGGAAGMARTLAAAAAGTVTAGGAASASVGVIASGAITAGGTATMAVAVATNATGQVTAGGVAVMLSARVAAAAGTVTAGGIAGASVEGVFVPETPPDRTVTIAAEDRTVTIPAEDRAVTIPAEDRAVAIPADDRTSP